MKALAAAPLTVCGGTSALSGGHSVGAEQDAKMNDWKISQHAAEDRQ
jgi:hypothetical protein